MEVGGVSRRSGAHVDVGLASRGAWLSTGSTRPHAGSPRSGSARCASPPSACSPRGVSPDLALCIVCAAHVSHASGMTMAW